MHARGPFRTPHDLNILRQANGRVHRLGQTDQQKVSIAFADCTNSGTSSTSSTTIFRLGQTDHQKSGCCVLVTRLSATFNGRKVVLVKSKRGSTSEESFMAVRDEEFENISSPDIEERDKEADPPAGGSQASKHKDGVLRFPLIEPASKKLKISGEEDAGA
ncbi:hypothetical protein BDV12DRAFT_192077 [Aspergillus spectabilis]